MENLIDDIRDAQDQILDAIQTLRHCARKLNDEWAERYIIAHLECLTTREHEWLDSSSNLDDWLEELANRELEEDGD